MVSEEERLDIAEAKASMKAKLKVKLKVFPKAKPKAWNKWPTLCVRMVCTKKISSVFFIERKKGSVITPVSTEAVISHTAGLLAGCAVFSPDRQLFNLDNHYFVCIFAKRLK